MISLPDKNRPLLLVACSLAFIYFFQYTLSVMLGFNQNAAQYSWGQWLNAWGFVVWSTLILICFLLLGMSGKSVKISQKPETSNPGSRTELAGILLVFAIFFVWSFVMLRLKIGITIYVDFEPLPFKMAGMLFYGRLFVQPIILAFIAHRYADGKWKLIVFILLFSLAIAVSLVSGSRFLAILFAVPFLYYFKNINKYIYFVFFVFIFILAASLSRNFFLPFVTDEELVQIYGTQASQTAAVHNALFLPIYYVVIRTMGMAEVLMTLNFGSITPGISDSFQNSVSYFVPFISKGASVSIKNIYGLNDDAFGGVGLDIFSKYWVCFGGNFLTFSVGLAFSSWLLGRVYRLIAIGLTRLGFSQGGLFVFLQLFLLFFEGRAFLFLPLLAFGWLFSLEQTTNLFGAFFRFVSNDRVAR